MLTEVRTHSPLSPMLLLQFTHTKTILFCFLMLLHVQEDCFFCLFSFFFFLPICSQNYFIKNYVAALAMVVNRFMNTLGIEWFIDNAFFYIVQIHS